MTLYSDGKAVALTGKLRLQLWNLRSCFQDGWVYSTRALREEGGYLAGSSAGMEAKELFQFLTKQVKHFGCQAGKEIFKRRRRPRSTSGALLKESRIPAVPDPGDPGKQLGVDRWGSKNRNHRDGGDHPSRRRSLCSGVDAEGEVNPWH